MTSEMEGSKLYVYKQYYYLKERKAYNNQNIGQIKKLSIE